MSKNVNVAALAEELSAATKAGDLAAAYRVLDGLSAENASAVALKAGYSVIFGRPKEVMTYIQQNVAKATRARTDGFGLRDITS